MLVAVVVVGLTVVGACVVSLQRRLLREDARRRFLESILNRVSDPIFVKDPDHRLVLVNDAECMLAGRARERLLGSTDYEFFPEDQVDVFWREDSLVLQTGRESINEEIITRADGALRIIETKKARFTLPDGAMYVVGVIRDITELRELERLRAEWSAIVAHDLRQPLGTISLNAQLIARHGNGPPVGEPVARIRYAADRLSRMVGDLMDMSRLDAHRLELAKRRVDVPALVRASLEDMGLQAPGRPIDMQAAPSIADAYADPDRVAQVMENLLTNALKYGNAGTPISVHVAQEEQQVVIAVSNEGKPIPAEELSRLFGRFQRTSSAKLKGVEGTGLGLYITRALVEAHGGCIAVESTPAGTTTFRFTLPVAARS